MAKPASNPEGSAPQPMLSTPLRNAPAPRNAPLRNLYSGMAASMPLLKKELDMAEIGMVPAQFVESCFVRTLPLTLALEVLLVLAMTQLTLEPVAFFGAAALGLPVFFFLTLQYFLMQPRMLSRRRGRKIDQELVFAGRHLLIELRSGVMLFDAMLGVTRDYGEVSREFNKIVEKVTLGVPMAAALHDVAEHCPSNYGRRVILQMANSLSSGSDVADSLESVLEQVSQEQIIQLKAYGQKLNPLVMFYMIFGVILPSLGVAFLIILLSFVGTGLSHYGPGLMVAVFCMVAIIQFMFLSVVENSRPSFDL
ncbi:Type II secretion system (T2SS), protein F [uncultured archaeon]|nr:Type II secretion system (T2SS), protein F [uncultured archaeon]